MRCKLSQSTELRAVEMPLVREESEENAGWVNQQIVFRDAPKAGIVSLFFMISIHFSV